MALFDDLFYSGPMLEIFSDEDRLRRMLDFESALAAAEAACGSYRRAPQRQSQPNAVSSCSTSRHFRRVPRRPEPQLYR